MRKGIGFHIILAILIGLAATILWNVPVIMPFKNLDKNSETIYTADDSSSRVETASTENVISLYLINPMMVKLPKGGTKIVYCIDIYSYSTNMASIVFVTPCVPNLFGEEIAIPSHNIRAIVIGKNKFKEHLLDE